MYQAFPVSSYLRHSVTKRIETSLSSKGSKLAGNSLTLTGKQCVSFTCPQEKESKEQSSSAEQIVARYMDKVVELTNKERMLSVWRVHFQIMELNIFKEFFVLHMKSLTNYLGKKAFERQAAFFR